MLLIAILIMSSMAQVAAPTRQKTDEPPKLELTDPADISDARELQDALDAHTTPVIACTKSGRPLEACRCEHPRQLVGLRKAFDGLLSKHPDWKDHSLSFHYFTKEGRSISSFMVLRNYELEIVDRENKCR